MEGIAGLRSKRNVVHRRRSVRLFDNQAESQLGIRSMIRALIIAAAAVLALAFPACALDQVLFKNGTRVTGTIYAQSRDHVYMRIGEGNVVYSKKAIRRIYDDITTRPPLTRMLRRDELPPWWIPLSDLYHEDWVNTLELVESGEIDNGDLKLVPYLSFRANGVYELNIYGDPDNPAALEIGYRGGWFRSGDAQKRCRQFMVSYLTGLRQLKALYSLNARGGKTVVDGLEIEITPRTAPDAYGGWWVALSNPARLESQRKASLAEWREGCEAMRREMLKWTDGETSWRKYSFKDALKRYVPLERMEER